MSSGLIQQTPDVLVQELEGELVFLNLETENYFYLDAIGKRMWEVLHTVESIERAVALLFAEFDADPAVLQHDVEQLLVQLRDAKLIR